MKSAFRILSCVAGLALAGTVHAADKAIIVLDASGSMWGQINGEAKIAIAREALGRVLKSVPGNLELGLIAYGHRDKGSCADIELVVPPAAGTAGTISAAANALTPKGKTPLTDAVRQAAEVLKYTEDKATVILITDGLETCDADPCAVASELEQAGIDFTVDVVGFGLSSTEGKQVACLAENTGGKYFSADNAAKLGAALTETVAETVSPAPAPPPPPLPPPAEAKVEKTLEVTSRPAPDAPPFTGADGIRYDAYKATADGHEENATTEYGGEGSAAEFELPAGRYVIIGRKDLASGEITIDVTDDRQTSADIVLNAGFIKARAMATETEPTSDDGVRWDVTVGENTDTSYGPTRTILVPAGEVKVTAGLGSATATVPVTVTAGKTEEVDVVLGAGTLALSGKRSAEASETDNGIRWDVTNTSGETVTTCGGQAKFNLPAGDYTVKATLGEAVAEVKVAVPAGKTVSQEIIVATGKIIAHALFAEGGPAVTASPRFDVLSAEKGEDGERKGIATAYNDGSSFDLPPGKYVLRATSDAAIAEAGIEVKAGPPQEISVVLNAGLLALSAPGGDRLDILGGKKDIYGKQQGIATTYGESWQIALPAGDYVVQVTKTDGAENTAPVNIKAGERTEVTVE